MKLIEINQDLWPILYGIRTFLKSPRIFSNEFLEDLKKDFADEGGLIWVAGLPKSEHYDDRRDSQFLWLCARK